MVARLEEVLEYRDTEFEIDAFEVPAIAEAPPSTEVPAEAEPAPVEAEPAPIEIPTAFEPPPVAEPEPRRRQSLLDWFRRRR
jgi:hypothetical protein